MAKIGPRIHAFKVNTSAIIDAHRRMLANPASSAEVRFRSIRALKKMGAVGIEQDLSSLLRDRQIGQKAAQQLGEIGTRQAIRFLRAEQKRLEEEQKGIDRGQKNEWGIYGPRVGERGRCERQLGLIKGLLEFEK